MTGGDHRRRSVDASGRRGLPAAATVRWRPSAALHYRRPPKGGSHRGRPPPTASDCQRTPASDVLSTQARKTRFLTCLFLQSPFPPVPTSGPLPDQARRRSSRRLLDLFCPRRRPGTAPDGARSWPRMSPFLGRRFLGFTLILILVV